MFNWKSLKPSNHMPDIIYLFHYISYALSYTFSYEKQRNKKENNIGKCENIKKYI